MNDTELKCSILIPTYNGKEILAECLPSMIDEVEARGGLDEILILDNASTDDTCSFLEKEYPSVRILKLNENKAIFALNEGAEAAKHPYLFFLNNDMILKPGCIDALMIPFKENDVFAVTGKVFQWDRETVQAGRRKPATVRGLFCYLPDDTDDAGLTVHALGGQSIYNRKMFLKLGGIDPLFSPFYHEDLDVSWRALRSGWRILYNPEAKMIHRGAATAGRMFTKKQIATIMQKNMFLFVWKNLHDPDITWSVLIWLIPRLLQAAVIGNFVFVSAFAAALKQLPDAMKSRKAAADLPLSDKEVFALFERHSS